MSKENEQCTSIDVFIFYNTLNLLLCWYAIILSQALIQVYLQKINSLNTYFRLKYKEIINIKLYYTAKIVSSI